MLVCSLLFMLSYHSIKNHFMKKTLLLLLFTVGLSSFSQENTSENKTPLTERKHEIKVGAIKLLAGPIFEGTYEYIHSKDFTLGSSILVNLQKDNSWYEDFSITPFARFYFQESKEYGAKGFFVEGFTKYSTGRYDEIEINGYFNKEKYTAFSIGLSLGKKWVNNTGFVFEPIFGIGRTLGNSEFGPDVLLRADLNIGYRF